MVKRRRVGALRKWQRGDSGGLELERIGLIDLELGLIGLIEWGPWLAGLIDLGLELRLVGVRERVPCLTTPCDRVELLGVER
jgi:hypothetical protein